MEVVDLFSVPARPISEGAAPCPYCLAPCPIYTAPCPNKIKIKFFIIFIFLFLQNVIAVFVFSDSRCKNACKCLQICAHVFLNRPQNCASISFRSRARLCPISLAPCPFPNLAGTLLLYVCPGIGITPLHCT